MQTALFPEAEPWPMSATVHFAVIDSRIVKALPSKTPAVLAE
jgi:hypothetical protein